MHALAQALNCCQFHNWFSFKGLQAMVFQGKEIFRPAEQKHKITAPPRFAAADFAFLARGNCHYCLPLSEMGFHSRIGACWKTRRLQGAAQSSAAAVNVSCLKYIY